MFCFLQWCVKPRAKRDRDSAERSLVTSLYPEVSTLDPNDRFIVLPCRTCGQNYLGDHAEESSVCAACNADASRADDSYIFSP